MTDTKTATQRIADLRKEAAAMGEPVTHLSDAEVAVRAYDQLWVEHRKIRNRGETMLQERVQHDRDVRSAIHRTTWEDVTAHWDRAAESAVSRALAAVRELVYRVSQLPARPSAAQIDELVTAGTAASFTLKLHRDVIDAGMDAAGLPFRELARVREVVFQKGRELHRELGGAQRGRCNCTGCDVIRTLDDVPAPVDA